MLHNFFIYEILEKIKKPQRPSGITNSKPMKYTGFLLHKSNQIIGIVKVLMLNATFQPNA